MDLTEFLLARIAEDQRWAEDYYPPPPMWISGRLLAECEAKRRIVELHGSVDPCDAHDASFRTVPCDTIRALALPYADHPDYDPTWRP